MKSDLATLETTQSVHVEEEEKDEIKQAEEYSRAVSRCLGSKLAVHWTRINPRWRSVGPDLQFTRGEQIPLCVLVDIFKTYCSYQTYLCL